MAQINILEGIRAAELKIRAKAQVTGNALKNSDPSEHRKIVIGNCQIIDELLILQTHVTDLKKAQDFPLDGPAISAVRSLNMVMAAQENFKTLGVWKIGERHIGHMQGVAEKKFNYLTQKEFNETFYAWLKKKYSFEELRFYYPNLSFV